MEVVSYVRMNEKHYITKICIDHKNNNKLDNSVENLRWCSKKQNSMNRLKQKSKSSSKYKGICFDKQNNKWRAYINIGGKRTHLGYFDNQIEAAEKYNEAANLHFGEFANINKF